MSDSYWNYRVVAGVDGYGETYYGIHEVYYNGKDEIEGWTRSPVSVGADTKEGLAAVLDQMLTTVYSKKVLWISGETLKPEVDQPEEVGTS